MSWLETLVEQLAAQSPLEWVAVFTALGYVWLAARQSIWCWPFAAVSTGIYTYLFWEHSILFHTMLNAYYLIMAVYGLYRWRGHEGGPVNVVQWSFKWQLSGALLTAMIALGMAMLADAALSPQFVYLDAFITAFSLYATLMVAHKVLENWLYWIVIDVFAAYLYWQIGMFPSSVLFMMYTVFAAYGYFSWRRSIVATAPQVA